MYLCFFHVSDKFLFDIFVSSSMTQPIYCELCNGIAAHMAAPLVVNANAVLDKCRDKNGIPHLPMLTERKAR